MSFSLIFLGTGSADNEERCQSALALVCPARDFLLFDTGSGLETFKQMLRAGLDPGHLRAIFVTHRHWDHVGGLFPLLIWLRLRHAEVLDRLSILGSEETVVSLEEMYRLSGHRGRFAFSSLTPGQTCRQGSEIVVEPFAVAHIPGSLGFRISLPHSVVVISGDTGPTDALVAAAAGADLLIHEATWDRAHQAEARLMPHSTGEDAGTAARLAGVRRLILTHLPATSVTAPETLQTEAATALGSTVDLAQDLGRVPLPLAEA